MSNKHIYKNTLYLYVRMFVMMLISLFSSRIVLQTLGSSDYGLYNVVGGFVAFFFFFGHSLSLACERFMAYAMGLKDDLLKKKVFSLSVIIFIILSIGILFIGLIGGVPFVKYKISIPVERIETAICVYVWSLILGVATFIRVPFNAAIIAYEKMTFYSWMSIIESVLKVAVLYMLYIGDYDKLLLYAILQTGVGVFVTIIYWGYCRFNFNDFILTNVLDKDLAKQMSKYVGWNVFGGFADLLILQGLTIILNMFFGTIINAAQAIASQIKSQIASFVNNLNIASGPAITKYYAARDFENCKRLLYTISKLDYLMLLIICVPVIYVLPSLLDLWLGAGMYPQETVIFTILVLVTTLAETLPGCSQSIVNSSGEIKKYHIVISVMKLLSVVAVYLALIISTRPEVAYYVLIVFVFPRVLFQIMEATRMLNLPVRSFWRHVLLPDLVVTVMSVGISYLLCVVNYSDIVFINFLAKGGLTLLITVLCSYILGLDKLERSKIKTLIINKIKNEV